MSGIVGHVTYAVLGSKAAQQRKLPVAPILHRHYASYLAGSYLGSDVQTLPAAMLVATGEEIGYCSASLTPAERQQGASRPFELEVAGKAYTPRRLYEMFYGRGHVVFGWYGEDRKHTVPWDHLPDYLALAVGDAMEQFGPGERKLAYLFGWLAHIVGDALIKSVQPGVTLHLLDGKYTPKNRPIQDLVCYHEVGRKELGLDWPSLLSDLVDTPVEPVQPHAMRVAKPRGQLAREFPNAWRPDWEPVLLALLAKNRQYQRVRNARILQELALQQTGGGWQCSAVLSEKTGGLGYPEMIRLAEEAGFRHALWQMGEAIADLFEAVIARQPILQQLPTNDGPTWQQLTRRWRRAKS